MAAFSQVLINICFYQLNKFVFQINIIIMNDYSYLLPVNSKSQEKQYKNC